MRIAVTAVSGKLGAEIVRALQATPDVGSVVGLARSPSKARDLGVEVRPGDYGEPNQPHLAFSVASLNPSRCMPLSHVARPAGSSP